MRPEKMTMYCTICGGPILEPGLCFWFGMPEWLESAVLLAKDRYNGGEIITIPAQNRGGPYFEIQSTNRPEKVTACHEYQSSTELKLTLYLPLHSVCLALVYEVAEAASPSSKAQALRKVWSVLHLRWVLASKDVTHTPTNIYDGVGFYGIGIYQGLDWEPCETIPELYHRVKYFEANPTTFPGFDVSILKTLRRLPAKSSSKTNEAKDSLNLDKLPLELVQRIFAHLRPLSDSTLACTYLVSGLHWKQALLDGSVIPWLPRLDAVEVARKEAEADRLGKIWDWEDLVREIAAIAFRQGPKTIEMERMGVPAGLWNRRRIWQLVENILETGALMVD